MRVSLATTLNNSAGGQFIAHAKALPGNPYDGHNAPPDYKFNIYISGQKRGLTEAIKRDLRRRPAIEAVIGHAKSDHRMDRNYHKGSTGDAINAVLAAAGYNFRRLLAWLRVFLRALLAWARPRHDRHLYAYAA